LLDLCLGPPKLIQGFVIQAHDRIAGRVAVRYAYQAHDKFVRDGVQSPNSVERRTLNCAFFLLPPFSLFPFRRYLSSLCR
jgi:hypothetical protein